MALVVALDVMGLRLRFARGTVIGLLALSAPAVAVAQTPPERAPRSLTMGYQHIVTGEGDRFAGGFSTLVFTERERWSGVLHASLTRSHPESFQRLTWLFVGGGVRVQGRPRRVVPWAQATAGLIRVADEIARSDRSSVRHHIGPMTQMGVGVNVAVNNRVGITASAEFRPYTVVSSVGVRYRWR